MRVSDDVAAAFGATVDVVGPEADALGYFAVVRRPDADHEAFLAAVRRAAGPDAHVLLRHANGVVVVGTSFGRAQSLRTHPSVRLVGAPRRRTGRVTIVSRLY